MTDDLVAALRELQAAGWAYSCEVWDESGDLVGGLFGMATSGVVSVDSVFHRVDHAGTAALLGITHVAAQLSVGVLDFQWDQDFHTRLGAEHLDPASFRQCLGESIERLGLPPGRFDVAVIATEHSTRQQERSTSVR